MVIWHAPRDRSRIAKALNGSGNEEAQSAGAVEWRDLVVGARVARAGILRSGRLRESGGRNCQK